MKIKFEPRDLWVGLYWSKSRTTTLYSDKEHFTFYVCVVPCFPLIFTLSKNVPLRKRGDNW